MESIATNTGRAGVILTRVEAATPAPGRLRSGRPIRVSRRSNTNTNTWAAILLTLALRAPSSSGRLVVFSLLSSACNGKLCARSHATQGWRSLASHVLNPEMRGAKPAFAKSRHAPACVPPRIGGHRRLFGGLLGGHRRFFGDRPPPSIGLCQPCLCVCEV